MDRWNVVTTVGTSLLTNYAGDQRRHDLIAAIREYANETETNVPVELRQELASVTDGLLSKASEAGPDVLKKMSAELNGLVSLYGERLFSRERRALDSHYLVATDTYFGAMCADLLSLILERLGFEHIQQPAFSGLTTKSYRAFAGGISQLVRWCRDELSTLRGSNSRVIFNLVGSFKSLQAYMNTLGMFYADEIIYIFEAEDAELIRIPRLPVQLAEVEALRDHLADFGLLAHGVSLDQHKAESIPEVFLQPAEEGRVRLGDWGAVVWDQHKTPLLAEAQPLKLPCITYERSYQTDFQRLTSDEKAQAQEAVLEAAAALMTGGIPALTGHKGLRYEPFESTKTDGRTIDHFRVNQEMRISCVRKGSKLTLRRVGRHDRVERRP